MAAATAWSRRASSPPPPRWASPERLRVIHARHRRPHRAPPPRRPRRRRPLPRRQYARSALVLGHVRGVVLLAGADVGLPVTAFAPATVKVQVTGFGRAEKSAGGVDGRAAPRSRGDGRAGDAADALAVALCHAHLRVTGDTLEPRRRPGLVIAHLRGPRPAQDARRKSSSTSAASDIACPFPVSHLLSSRRRRARRSASASTPTCAKTRSPSSASSPRHEQELFERLIAVAGVGPKLAVDILSGIEAADFVAALRANDLARLTRIPGVGKKTAERLVLELKDKMPAVLVGEPAAAAPAAAASPKDDLALGARQPRLLARRGGAGVDRALREAATGRFEDLLRRALQMLAGPLRPHGTLRAAHRVRAADRRRRRLRPVAAAATTLDEYVGQPQVVANLRVAIEAARSRGEALDHVLLFGPPGVGKTSLAHVIAAELRGGDQGHRRPHHRACRATWPRSSPPSTRARSSSSTRSTASTRKVEEILYPALEDSTLDLMIGTGPGRALHEDPAEALHPGGRHHARGPAHRAPARPLRDRAPPRLLLRRPTSSSSSRAPRASSASPSTRGRRGRDRAPQPRHAAHRQPPPAPRARFRARSGPAGVITAAVARDACALLEVDEHGFDEVDRKLLLTIIDKFGGGPVGVDALAAAISEETGRHRGHLRAVPAADRLPRPHARAGAWPPAGPTSISGRAAPARAAPASRSFLGAVEDLAPSTTTLPPEAHRPGAAPGARRRRASCVLDRDDGRAHRARSFRDLPLLLAPRRPPGRQPQPRLPRPPAGPAPKGGEARSSSCCATCGDDRGTPSSVPAGASAPGRRGHPRRRASPS